MLFPFDKFPLSKFAQGAIIFLSLYFDVGTYRPKKMIEGAVEKLYIFLTEVLETFIHF